jgi:hypothetical protein
MKIFSTLGGESVAIKLIFGEQLASGERYAKHVKRQQIGSQHQVFK